MYYDQKEKEWVRHEYTLPFGLGMKSRNLQIEDPDDKVLTTWQKRGLELEDSITALYDNLTNRCHSDGLIGFIKHYGSNGEYSNKVWQELLEANSPGEFLCGTSDNKHCEESLTGKYIEAKNKFHTCLEDNREVLRKQHLPVISTVEHVLIKHKHLPHVENYLYDDDPVEYEIKLRSDNQHDYDVAKKVLLSLWRDFEDCKQDIIDFCIAFNMLAIDIHEDFISTERNGRRNDRNAIEIPYLRNPADNGWTGYLLPLEALKAQYPDNRYLEEREQLDNQIIVATQLQNQRLDLYNKLLEEKKNRPYNVEHYIRWRNCEKQRKEYEERQAVILKKKVKQQQIYEAAAPAREKIRRRRLSVISQQGCGCTGSDGNPKNFYVTLERAEAAAEKQPVNLRIYGCPLADDGYHLTSKVN